MSDINDVVRGGGGLRDLKTQARVNAVIIPLDLARTASMGVDNLEALLAALPGAQNQKELLATHGGDREWLHAVAHAWVHKESECRGWLNRIGAMHGLGGPVQALTGIIRTAAKELAAQAGPKRQAQEDQGVARRPSGGCRFIDPDDAEPDPEVLAQLTPSKTDPVAASAPNAYRILDMDRRWKGRLKYSDFSYEVEFDGVALEEERDEVGAWIEHVYGADLKSTDLVRALGTVGRRHRYHPVRDYLEAREWDGTPRLETWLTTYAGVEKDPLKYGEKFCISAVARIFQPGCQVDQVLILVDPKQGLGKSSLVRTLAGLEYYSETPLKPGDKDSYIQLWGVWIYELGELAAIKRGDNEGVKAYVTTRYDKFRPPYGTSTRKYGRQCVFLGTTNETNFLPEGGRRWWILDVTKPIDLAALARDRDQLWAEAVVLYRAEKPWHLTGDEVAAQKSATEDYVKYEPWEVCVQDFIRNPRKYMDGPLRSDGTYAWNRYDGVSFTIDDVLDAVGSKMERRGHSDSQRVAAVLSRLKCERLGQVSQDGVRKNRWSAPVTPDKPREGVAEPEG